MINKIKSQGFSRMLLERKLSGSPKKKKREVPHFKNS